MSKKTFVITKTQLQELYINQNMRRIDVAKQFGCSDVLIKKLCQKYEIKKPMTLSNKNRERKESVYCCNCGNSFIANHYRATTQSNRKAKFCSPKCSSDYRFLGLEHKKAIRNEIASRRRARLYGQTPILTEDEKLQLLTIYLNRPDGWEVDHIIPLAKGGLHHPNNLQYLPKSINRKKWIHVS